MAKVNSGGASFTEHEQTDTEFILSQRPTIGGVDKSSAGTSTSGSSERQSRIDGSERLPPRLPAPMTENLSGQTQTEEVSDAHSTGGNGLTTESPLSVDDGDPEDDEVQPYDMWTVEELANECRARTLAVSGTKSILIGRLEEDDRAQDA